MLDLSNNAGQHHASNVDVVPDIELADAFDEGPSGLHLKAVNDMSLPEAALYYAKLGIPVFPLQPNGKKPFSGSHGCTEATTREGVVRQWWLTNPDANIGIATGGGAGFLVLDVDGDEGAESLKNLEKEHGSLPGTAISLTARGKHILFTDADGIKNSTSALGPKLDIRATGGYIVAPPSIHESGHCYRWLHDGEIAKLPGWLSGLLAKKIFQPQEAKVTSPIADDTIAEGSRNSSLASFAGLLLRKGCSGEELFDLLNTFNHNRCDPPLSDREVRGIARSISKYPIGSENFSLTDLGNAHRFVALHGENVRYTLRAKLWLFWCGTHWKEIDPDELMQKVFEVPPVIALEAANALGDEATKLYKHAAKTQGRARLEAILELAKTLLIIEADRLDNDPFLLSVKNGQIDLRSGKLSPHRREDFITKYIDIAYDPNASCQRWDTFIDEVTCGDKDLARFLQSVSGYCLTGSVEEQVLFIFHGHGANGKSTFIEMLKTLMGPYAAKTPMTTFLSFKGEKPSNDLARLRGTRFVSAVEVGRGDRLNEPLLKELTGGDTIAARFLFKEFFDFRPQFKIVMSVNDLPRIEAGDEAINRRLRIVPFDATFAAEKCDKNLPEKLREELPGILRWFIEGSVAWRREGLGKPAAIKAATESYINANDTLGEFINDCCFVGEGNTTVNDFFRAYSGWLKETHGLDTNKTALGRLMGKKGYMSKVRKGERMYFGVCYDKPNHKY